MKIVLLHRTRISSMRKGPGKKKKLATKEGVAVLSDPLLVHPVQFSMFSPGFEPENALQCYSREKDGGKGEKKVVA